jgi:ribosomal protein S18 acetylase RimI-like enzyme
VDEMNIRRAAEADEAELSRLWADFCTEVPEPPGFPPEEWSEQWDAIRKSLEGGAVYVAESEGRLAGVVHVQRPDRGVAHLEWAHVGKEGRRQGLVKALLERALEDVKGQGVTLVTLEALKGNEPALTVWQRLGFEAVEFFMAAPLDALELRLAKTPDGPSRASTHVQSDDKTSVERALAQFVPRLQSPDLRDAENGWIRIVDPVMDADRTAQARLARELSDRLGAVVVALALERSTVVRFQLYERGRMVDEYLSVPTFYGTLPKGDELALAANPTLVARLTGADHDEVRRVARTAASPAELPPAEELYAEIGRLMGLEP